jgi:hypothetical protein
MDTQVIQKARRAIAIAQKLLQPGGDPPTAEKVRAVQKSIGDIRTEIETIMVRLDPPAPTVKGDGGLAKLQADLAEQSRQVEALTVIANDQRRQIQRLGVAVS